MKPRFVAAIPLLLALWSCWCLGAVKAMAVEPRPSSSPSLGVPEVAPPGTAGEAVLFYVLATGAVVSSIGVCVSKNIVRMAVWLFGALGSVALSYFLLAANFLGAIQLIVYAGGTLVLLIFGIMLTNKSPWVRFEPRAREVAAAALVCGGLLTGLCLVLTRMEWASSQGALRGVAIVELGRRLVMTYLVPFEAAGVLLMIVLVGAAHLARQERS